MISCDLVTSSVFALDWRSPSKNMIFIPITSVVTVVSTVKGRGFDDPLGLDRS